jgi:hypothetical protein
VTRRIVEISIDELVLDGVGEAGRERIAAAATRELERLLASSGRWSGREADSVVVSPQGLGAAAGRSPESVGVEVARSVHRELTS